MNKLFSIICVSLLILSFTACKEETKKVTIDPSKEKFLKKEKKPLSEVEKKKVGSVLARLMARPESKTITSYVISAEMTNTLMKEDGPFTIFAPTNEAFAGLTEEKRKVLANSKNKQLIVDLVKNHVIAGKLDSATIVQRLKENGGSLLLDTMSGITLTISKKGDDIVIKDSKGNTATLGKSDILASNGVVHVIDKVLE